MVISGDTRIHAASSRSSGRGWLCSVDTAWPKGTLEIQSPSPGIRLAEENRPPTAKGGTPASKGQCELRKGNPKPL